VNDFILFFILKRKEQNMSTKGRERGAADL
jgi:hypothetical protein